MSEGIQAMLDGWYLAVDLSPLTQANAERLQGPKDRILVMTTDPAVARAIASDEARRCDCCGSRVASDDVLEKHVVVAKMVWV